ncbi:MAG: hypothetical protein AAF138_06615 [Planctomycetota bacterium]
MSGRHPKDVQADKYALRALRHLKLRAPWLLEHQVAVPQLTFSEQTIAETRKWIESRGFLLPPGWPKRNRIRHTRFELWAPKLPRDLEIHNEYRKENLGDLRLIVDVDGDGPRCLTRFAGAQRSSLRPLTYEQALAQERFQFYPIEPEADIDRLIDFIDAILDDRVVILRSVHYGEIGHGSALFPLTGDHFVESHKPINEQLKRLGGRSLEHAAEAIIYTWSGDGDRVLVEPSYDDPPR